MSRQSHAGTVIFIDENLKDKKIGLLSIPWPPAPQQILARIREKHGMHDEMKWSTISRQKVPFLTDVIETFFANTSFGRINIIPIAGSLDDAIFHALQVVYPHCFPYNGIFIDDHTTPKGYEFERKLKTTFDCNCVPRLDSKATQLLQLCDLMLNLTIRVSADVLPASEHKARLVEVFKVARNKSPFPRCFLWP